MAELSKVYRCYHCGVVLQNEDPNKPGYIEKEVMDKYPEGLLLCDNCFKNERFNNSPKEVNFEAGYESILDEIKAKNALVVYVVDVFSFEGSFISKLNKKLEGIDVFAVANKRDLLPVDADNEILEHYIEHRLRVSKLAVKDSILVSSTSGYNMNILHEKLIKYGKNRDIYFIGATTSGKSAIIEDFLRNYTNNTHNLITTYTFNDSDLRGFRIPTSDDHYIYETPGTSINNSIIAKVDRISQNQIIPKKTVKARTLKLSVNNTVLFGGLVGIQLISGTRTEISCYASNEVDINLIKSDLDKNLLNLLKKKKVSPIVDFIKSATDFDAYDIQITEKGSRDIGILGLGWINFVGNSQLFRIFVPKGVYVYTTRGKVQYVNKQK
jgi:30S ribosome assembly GTPase